MRIKAPTFMKKRALSLALIAGGGIILAVLFGNMVRIWQENQKFVFQNEWVNALSVELKSEILSSTQILYALKSLILASEEFPKEAFEIFVSSSLIRYPSVQNIMWAEREENEQANVTFPVKMELSRNKTQFLGKDIKGFQQVPNIIERAQRNHRMLLNPNSPMNKGQAFLGVLPVAENRRVVGGALRGVLLAEFDLSSVYERVLEAKNLHTDAIRLRDVTLPNVPKTIYMDNWGDDVEPTISKRFSVAGRIVEIELLTHIEGEYIDTWVFVVILVLFITCLIVLLYLKIEKTADAIEQGIQQETYDLKQRNLLYQFFVNNTSQGFLVLDEDGVILNSNTASDELFEVGYGGCRNQHISKFLSKRSYDKFFCPPVHGNILKPKELNKTIPIVGQMVNGCEVHIDAYIAKLEGLEKAKWLFLCRNITKRIETVDRLRRSDRQFRQAFLLGFVPMVILDNGGKIQDSNKSFQKFLGYEANDIFNTRIRDYMHPDVIDEFVDWVANANDNKLENFQCEQRLLNRTGYNLWVIASYSAVYQIDGNLKNIICQYHDFTDRRYAEEELKLHRDKLAELVVERTKEAEETRESLIASINAADNAILVYDNENNLEFSSDLLVDFFPEMKGEIQPGISARRLSELGSIRTGENDEEREARLKRLQDGVSGDEYQLIDGRWIQTSRRKTPSGGTVVVHTDITSYKKQEELLRQQASDLAASLRKQQEVNELQKMFVSVVSHEFKTPLAIIDSGAQRILRNSEKLTTEELQNKLGRIRSAVKRLLTLIESTLTAQRIETGKIAYSPQICNLSEVVMDICNHHQELARNHEIEIVHAEAGIEVLLDRELMDLALTNLLNNAEKYSELGSQIRIRVGQDEDNAYVSVQDEGLGIADAEQGQIFNRFFRSSSVGTTEGTGIGLAIVKQVMEMHSGRIEFHSKLGVGSRFTLLIPKE